MLSAPMNLLNKQRKVKYDIILLNNILQKIIQSSIYTINTIVVFL